MPGNNDKWQRKRNNLWPCQPQGRVCVFVCVRLLCICSCREVGGEGGGVACWHANLLPIVANTEAGQCCSRQGGIVFSLTALLKIHKQINSRINEPKSRSSTSVLTRVGCDLSESKCSNPKGISWVEGVECHAGEAGRGGAKVLGNRKWKGVRLIPGHSIEPSKNVLMMADKRQPLKNGALIGRHVQTHCWAQAAMHAFC